MRYEKFVFLHVYLFISYMGYVMFVPLHGIRVYIFNGVCNVCIFTCYTCLYLKWNMKCLYFTWSMQYWFLHGVCNVDIIT